MKRVCLAAILLFVVGLGNVRKSDAQKIKGADMPRGVSLIQLIAAPEKYENKKVMFIAFLAFAPGREVEGDAFYLTQEDFRHSIRYNSISFERSEFVATSCKKFDKQYVVVSGEFRAPRPTEDWTGQVVNISRCTLWSSVEDPRGLKSGHE